MLHDSVSRRAFVAGLTLAPLAAPQSEWISLFDGKTLTGWRPSENKSSWRVVNGMLAADGPRSHLFYDGATHGADFKNFELEVLLTSRPQCNSGIYFHTAYQETGFPEKGFEIQINNSALGDDGYRERKKTASLYGVRNMYKQLVPDDKPFHVHVTVRGKNVQIRLNDQLVVDYVEPTPPVIPEGGEKGRFLDHGTFALQCHNDGSHAFYQTVRVRPLPDDLPAYSKPAPVADQTFKDIINIGRHNIPMVDFHVFLRDGMTSEELLRKSRADGIQSSITANAAELKTDHDVDRWLAPYHGRPLFFALSAPDGTWQHRLSRSAAKEFDLIVASSVEWADKRAPSASDTQTLPEAEAFTDALVAEMVRRMDQEPIDLYSNLTYLPPAFRPQRDQLWTDARIGKLIQALLRNKVAIELNTSTKLPDEKFVRQAKDAGCKFAFGTANKTAAGLERCEYGLHIVKTCALEWQNFYAPGSFWPKAVDRRWTASA